MQQINLVFNSSFWINQNKWKDYKGLQYRSKGKAHQRRLIDSINVKQIKTKQMKIDEEGRWKDAVASVEKGVSYGKGVAGDWSAVAEGWRWSTEGVLWIWRSQSEMGQTKAVPIDIVVEGCGFRKLEYEMAREGRWLGVMSSWLLLINLGVGEVIFTGEISRRRRGGRKTEGWDGRETKEIDG